MPVWRSSPSRVPLDTRTPITVGKAEKTLSALKELDLVFVHVEAPDEMGHEGNLEGKIKAIEDFDEKVVGTILQGVEQSRDFRIAVLSDHPTPIWPENTCRRPQPVCRPLFQSDGKSGPGDRFRRECSQKGRQSDFSGISVHGNFHRQLEKRC